MHLKYICAQSKSLLLAHKIANNFFYFMVSIKQVLIIYCPVNKTLKFRYASNTNFYTRFELQNKV